ncbi:MAG: MFS transporter [Campylobacteraceae bacterium]|nr:MFS transporter [Campylobacteraceae bacterium]
MAKSPYKKYRYMMMLGHFCTDINQGALPAILTFLVIHNNINYTAATGLVFAANFVSSIIQPLFGYLGDKRSLPQFISLGIFLAGFGLGIVGFLENYWIIFLCVAISGIGIALFHPEGSRVANIVSGKKKGSGMGFFSFGGSLGFAVGPILISFFMSMWGSKGTIVLIVPSLVMSLIVLLSGKTIMRFKSEVSIKKVSKKAKQFRDDWGAFYKLSLAVFCRSIVSYGLITFIPIYFVKVLSQSETFANLNLTLFAAIGATATFFGGRFADKYGFNRVIKICFLALLPAVLLFLQTDNAFLAVLFIIPMAIALNGAGSVMIVMGQSFLPNRIGFAAGITMGLGVSIGGAAMPFIGFIGDKFELPSAMYTLAFFAFLTLVFAFIIPKQGSNKISED